MTIFREIPGFPGYFVSNQGTVVSTKQGQEPRALKPGTLGPGYRFVALRRDGQTHNRLIHRLVLETFVGPCPPGHETRHLNGLFDDNRLSNLQWGSPHQNAQDRFTHGTKNQEKKPPQKWSWAKRTRRLSNEQIHEICRLHREGIKIPIIAHQFGVSGSLIEKITSGLYYRHVPRP